MRVIAFALLTAILIAGATHAQYYGNLSNNPTMMPALPQPPNTFNNPLGNSASSPGLYDSRGQFHGNLNANPLDPDSVANPLGRYGSSLSPDSINNPLGYGSRLNPDSPNDPLGTGMRIYGPRH